MSSAPSSRGKALKSSSASTSEGRVISTKWPNSPKPVRSVQAFDPYSRRHCAPNRLLFTIDSSAASIQRPLVFNCGRAANRVPVPIGLVSKIASPGRMPPLIITPSRFSSTKPLMAKPKANSRPSPVWPPTNAQPASFSTSTAPLII